MKKLTETVYISQIPYPNKPLIIEGNNLILIDPGCDPVDNINSSFNEILDLSEKLAKPVTNIIVTHSHYDHCMNLDSYLNKFDATLIAESNTPLKAKKGILINQEEAKEIEGITLNFIPSPGHSEQMDDLSIFYEKDKILFCGDLSQPQGREYHRATAFSPVPYFSNGDKYMATLGRLVELPFEILQTGHGETLRDFEARAALDVTMTVILRIMDLSIKLAEENPRASEATISEWIFDTICWERSFDKKLAEKRKTLRRNTGPTDYEDFDLPGIAYFVKKAIGNNPQRVRENYAAR